MGIAHHSCYFVWFEECRSAFCRSQGLPYGEWEKNGVFLPVVEVGCRYKSPLLYDELVTMESWADDISPASITLHYVLKHADGKTASEGWTKHAFADADGRLIRRKNDYVEKVKRIFIEDGGEPVV